MQNVKYSSILSHMFLTIAHYNLAAITMGLSGVDGMLISVCCQGDHLTASSQYKDNNLKIVEPEIEKVEPFNNTEENLTNKYSQRIVLIQIHRYQKM